MRHLGVVGRGVNRVTPMAAAPLPPKAEPEEKPDEPDAKKQRVSDEEADQNGCPQQ